MIFVKKISGCAFLGISMLLASCGLGQDIIVEPEPPPVIAYASPQTFSVGVAAAQAVSSTGGPVTGYTVAPPLPEGLALDAGTGTIAGVALDAYAESQYSVIATGPGGADTAVILLRAVAVPVDPAVPRPQIAYLSPVTDTAGKTASHPVISSGGPVTGFSVVTPLPPGLTLNASSGLIAGSPTEPRTAVAHAVIAYGPGGRDTAMIVIAVAANPNVARPQIAYTSPVTDTVGRPAAHAVISTGGPVTSYSILSAYDFFFIALPKPQLTISPDYQSIPPGLTLNAQTGLISGVPTYYGPYNGQAIDYRVIATGPGGSDTATIRITVVTQGDPIPEPITSGIELSVTLIPPFDYSAVEPLEKAAVVPLRRMIVTLWSNVNDTIRDTIYAGTQGFSADRSGNQTVVKRYGAARPLRWWNVTVQVTDVNGVLIYSGAGGPVSTQIGELQPISMTLSPRFTPYRTVFNFPDSLRSVSAGAIAKININRFVLVVDGDTVRDSVAPGGGYFAPAPATHLLEYDYLNPGVLHAMAIYVYGNVSASVAGSYLLFGGTFNYTATGGTHNPPLNWMRPAFVMPGSVPFLLD